MYIKYNELSENLQKLILNECSYENEMGGMEDAEQFTLDYLKNNDELFYIEKKDCVEQLFINRKGDMEVCDTFYI